MEAVLHPVSQNDCEDDDFISQAISLFSQQIWCWGRDIRRKQGNWLLELGFERVRPPAGVEIEDSVYTLKLTENRSIILRGFGVYYCDNAHGAIFLPRYEFIRGTRKIPRSNNRFGVLMNCQNCIFQQSLNGTGTPLC